MQDRTLPRTGVVSSIVAALCCGTPILVLVFGALGVSASLAYADYVLLPALIACLALTFYALHRRRTRRGAP